MSAWTDAEILWVLWRFHVEGETAAQLGISVAASRNAVLGLVKRVRDAGYDVEVRRLRDHERFVILDRVLARVPSEVVAKDFAVSRMAVLNLVFAILRETAEAGPDLPLRRPEARLCLSWPDWWRAGPARGVAA